MPGAPKLVFIRVNGQLVYLDEAELNNGQFCLARESLSEQCDGCSSDIEKTGTPNEGGQVRCSRCGAFYDICSER